MGEQTDTADLVKAAQRLDDAYRIWVAGGSSKVNAAKLLDTWPTIKAALSATQARADKLEAELVEAKRERDELREEVVKIKHGDGWRAFEDAKAALGRIIGDDYADRSMWPQLRRR